MFLRLSIVLLLTGWWVHLPAMAEVMLCPREGARIEMQGKIFDAALVRVLEAQSRKEVARFTANDPTPPTWQTPTGAQICYSIEVTLSAAPNREALCFANDKHIGYSLEPDALFSVLLHYRNARLKTHGTPCDVLPDQREASPAIPLPAPVVASKPPVTAGASSLPSPVVAPKPPFTASDGAPPVFAWPPPRPSTRRTLSRPLVVGNIATPSLGSVADRLQAALEASGYTEYSYYSVPGGFALATRLERIYADGRSMPEPKRWEMAGSPLTRFELGEYLRALFDAERGHFRVIVFIATPQTLVAGTEPPSAATALNWPHQGAPVLPEALRSLAYGSAFQTHALIYEFETLGQGQPAQFKANSTITGETHLRRANILGALQP